jgi:hypothetical protein
MRRSGEHETDARQIHPWPELGPDQVVKDVGIAEPHAHVMAFDQSQDLVCVHVGRHHDRPTHEKDR